MLLFSSLTAEAATEQETGAKPHWDQSYSLCDPGIFRDGQKPARVKEAFIRSTLSQRKKKYSIAHFLNLKETLFFSQTQQVQFGAGCQPWLFKSRGTCPLTKHPIVSYKRVAGASFIPKAFSESSTAVHLTGC